MCNGNCLPSPHQGEGTIVNTLKKLITCCTGAMLLNLAIGTVPAGAAQHPDFAFGNPLQNDSCLRCHSSMNAVGENGYIDPLKFAQSTHASIGCTTCHDAIGAIHPDGAPTPVRTTCADCHQGITKEYSTSSHIKNAACTGCHDPHTVLTLAETFGIEIKRQCGGCHNETTMTAKHARWLPQAELHLATIPCITCHVEGKELLVTTTIVKRQLRGMHESLEPASYAELKKLMPGRNISAIVDSDGDGTVSLTELRAFNHNPLYATYCLAGIMTPARISHDFKIINNRWDCTFCHAKGPGAITSSSLALPTEAGTYRRLPVESGAVLEALNGIPDFYLMGSTRSELLNKIGLVILGGGMVMPVGHGMLRFLTRRNRNGKEH